jgi:serine/threonine-protein kinase
MDADPLAGRYRLEAKLGSGGMGTVYRATDLTSGRTVALKVLHAYLATSVEFLKRFEREARVMAALSHPNLINLLSIERDDQLPFLVMPFIEGQSLRHLLKTRERLTAREALPILAQLCDGLGYLHARGVVHRDVKPDNVLLSADGHVTLLDFGLSRKGGPGELTEPGRLLGTLRYMAPEQARDQGVDFRADLYSLGLFTYHLLTGVTPFGADNGHATILKHLFETPELASRMSPAVSDAVARVLARALEKEPAARHPSTQAFFDDFSAAFSIDATAGDTRNAETATSNTELSNVRAQEPEVTVPARPGLLAAMKRLLRRD